MQYIETVYDYALGNIKQPLFLKRNRVSQEHIIKKVKGKNLYIYYVSISTKFLYAVCPVLKTEVCPEKTEQNRTNH